MKLVGFTVSVRCMFIRVDSIMTLDSTAHCWSILKDSLGFALHKDIKKSSLIGAYFPWGSKCTAVHNFSLTNLSLVRKNLFSEFSERWPRVLRVNTNLKRHGCNVCMLFCSCCILLLRYIIYYNYWQPTYKKYVQFRHIFWGMNSITATAKFVNYGFLIILENQYSGLTWQNTIKHNTCGSIFSEVLHIFRKTVI